MNTQPQQKISVQTLTQLAILVAIEVVMKLIGLGSVPVGPLYMSFLTVPIAVGAMTMGPTAGAILGGVFGLVSMKDAITGVSAMTSVFFQISPINTFVLCVVMRVLMGWCVGLLFRVLRRVDHKKSWSYFVGALSAPLLNTIFFMGYIVLVFYKTDNALTWMLYSIMGGGAMLGAIFMATDYVTSPTLPSAQLVYGIGCGALTVLFRYFGLFPEGVTYAILIMNACAWALDRAVPVKRFGVGKGGAGK